MKHREQSHLEYEKSGPSRIQKRPAGALALVFSSIATLLVLGACNGDLTTEEGGLRILDPDTLQTWLGQSKELVLMDARPDGLFDAGHIAGSIRVHGRRVGEVRAVLPFNPEVPIVFTSEHGKIPVDEDHLVHVLVGQGFPQVWWLEGGIEEWRRRNYPLDGSRVFKRRDTSGP